MTAAAGPNMSVAELAELLADRLKLTDGELRIAFKDGRYQRAHALLPVSKLAR